MSSDDPALQPVIVLRVVIRSPDLSTFVSKYSRFVKDDRIFIFTKSSQPPGTRVRFTLELADGTSLIHGEGTVQRVRGDQGDPAKPPGMELKFVPLDGPSRDLVARMLAERENVNQFRDEPSDVQTAVRDGTSATKARNEFDEPSRTLEPLERTGAQPSLRDGVQTDTGAVTIAANPPRPDETPPPMPPPVPPLPPQPIPSMAPIPSPDESSHPSGSFSSPTPLPAPIPAEADYSPPPTGAPTRSEKVAPHGSVTLDHFPAVGPAPAFAEAFRHPLANVTPPSGTVPANPFSEISDGAIEYFVEWSLEQSTAPKPKVAEASFANVPMATPRVEKRRVARGPLLAGMAIGVFIGLPLGGAVVWYFRPLMPPIVVEKVLPRATAPVPVAAPVTTIDMTTLARATPDLAPAIAAAAPPDLGHAVVEATEKPASAPAATGKPAELQVTTKPAGAQISVDGEARGKTPLTLKLPSGAHELVVTRERYATVTQTVDVPGNVTVTLHRPPATLHVESEPPGGEVIVEGKPRGKTPVDVTLDAFHHYDVQVMLLGTEPWHKKVSLKPPQTNVIAKLSVVHH